MARGPIFTLTYQGQLLIVRSLPLWVPDVLWAYEGPYEINLPHFCSGPQKLLFFEDEELSPVSVPK